MVVGLLHSWVRGKRAAALLARCRRFGWPAACVGVSAAFLLAIIRPLSPPPPDPQADDVIGAWNDSISRLGIEPLYPPREDVQVGDIVAMVLSGPDELRKVMEPVARLDLKPDIIERQRQRLLFPESSPPVTGGGTAWQDRFEAGYGPDPGRVGLRLIAFPGVSFQHTLHRGGTTRMPFFGLGASRDTSATEEIQIRAAETYGIEASEAYARADQWCKAPAPDAGPLKGIHLCNEDVVRMVLAETQVGPAILERDACDRYKYPIVLRMVYKVYLTREIIQRRVDEDARDATGSAAEGKRPAPADEPGIPVRGAGAAVEARFTQKNGVETGIHTVFQRPVVFGYNMLNFTPNPPEGGGNAKCH